MGIREIKFRALKRKCWYYLVLDNPAAIDRELLAQFAGEVIYFETPWLEYTGLKDKKGREIYEGDILTGSHPDFTLNGFRDNSKIVVEYIDGAFYPFADNEDNMPYPKSDRDCEVIGNIYENKDLLNAK